MNNYDSVLNQLQAAGLIIDGALHFGKMRRCKVEGDREKRGWYALHEITGQDGPLIVGSYGVWRGNDANATKIQIERSALTPDQADALKKRIADDRKRADAERARDAARAAQEAARVWRQYLPGDGQSDYLTRKGVKAWGVRWAPSGAGTFAVPMMDAAGGIAGLQIIRGKNRRPGQLEKEYFPRGLAKKGRYHTISVIRDLVLVAEGYATAATLHQATGLPVVVAFDAGNLGPVCEAIKNAYPRARILVCADDDYLTPGNPGCTAAELAALACGGTWIKPAFADDRAGKKLTDFNDLAALEGEPTVRAQIQSAVARLQGGAAPILARGALPEGGGENGIRLSMLTPDEVVSRFSPVWSDEDVYYFDHTERVVVKKSSISNRMPRGAFDLVTTHPDWKIKPEVPLSKVDFDPSESDPDVVYNLWGGWKNQKSITAPALDGQVITRVEWAEQSSRALRKLLKKLCSYEADKHEEIYTWVLKWLAYPLRHPGAKMQSCILMHGGQGAGKNTFFDVLLAIYNEHAVEFGPSQLEKRFNALFSKKMFAIGNEVVASREDLYHVKGHIKHMITERRWVVEAKGKDERWERNCCNFVFLSNEINPQALEKGDRRHCVIWTPHVPDKDKDPEHWQEWWDTYWGPAKEEAKNGGAAALYWYLMECVDLEGFHEGVWPPMTQAKQDLIDLNLDSRERFYNLWLHEDINGLPCIPVTSELLHEAYAVWVGKTKIGRIAPQHSLMAFIGKQPGIKKKQENIRIGQKHEKLTVVFPHFMHDAPPGQTISGWLGNCVEEFRTALEAYRA